MIDIELVAVHYILAVGNYQQSPAARKVHYTNVAEEEIQFSRKCLSCTDVFLLLDNQSHGKVPTVSLSRTSEMNHILRLLAEGKLSVVDPENPRRRKSSPSSGKECEMHEIPCLQVIQTWSARHRCIRRDHCDWEGVFFNLAATASGLV